MPPDLLELVEDISNLSNPNEHCFLCGRRPENQTLTQEHVIPLWAQRRYKLHDQRLMLLNGTAISYRYLTVPCCCQCNSEMLKPLEDAIAGTVESGVRALDGLGKSIPILWLSKILYGLLYKQLLSLYDRSRPASGTILDRKCLEDYYSLRFALQQARNLVKPANFEHGSIFTFEMQPIAHKADEWDFRDCVSTLFVACRIGKTGIIAVLGDGGAQQPFEEEYLEFKYFGLHPIQFRELAAHICYRSLLLNRTPKYLTIGGTPHLTFQSPLSGYSHKPLFDDWDAESHAKVLGEFIGMPWQELYSPPDGVATWLKDAEGNTRRMDDE